jgi:hypothetical protein
LLGRAACDSALPAADFDVDEVRPSRKTLDAAVAAFFDVVSVLDLLCVNVLPAAIFDAFPVSGERNVLEAALAAAGPVFLLVAITFS